MLQFNANVKPEFVNIPFFPYVYLYDVDKSLQKVSEEINKFIDLQCKYFNLMPPKITQDYKIYFSTYTISDKVGDSVAKKLDTLEEVKMYYNKFANALEVLNYEELVFFTEVLYSKQLKEYQCAEKLNTTTYLLKTIKESCILKLARALDVAVLKA